MKGPAASPTVPLTSIVWLVVKWELFIVAVRRPFVFVFGVGVIVVVVVVVDWFPANCDATKSGSVSGITAAETGVVIEWS
jgi:multidrug resistance efflux pump